MFYTFREHGTSYNADFDGDLERTLHLVLNSEMPYKLPNTLVWENIVSLVFNITR